MSDLNLEVGLTANAGPLNAALQSSAQSVQQFGKTAEAASRGATTASQEAEAAALRGARTRKQTSSDEAAAAAASRAAKASEQAAMRESTAAANNLKQAYRQLPMQITDVTTSLASGMPMWMVAIQQGGQIKDSFGGIQPAMQGVLSLLTPTRLAMGALAATAGTLAVAYNSGAAEADAYHRAIVMSGNASGVTAGQLQQMAVAMDRVVGTQAQAAEALAQAVATGQVAAQNLQAVATVAVKMQRELGIAVQDTVGDFAALGKDPVAASVRLNQQYNYLTIAVYEQIKALQKRGQVEAAADLAQRTFAAAMDTRTEQLKGNLGAIERAWRTVKDAAAEAWDAILGIGRKQTTEQQLDQVNKQIETLQASRSVGRNAGKRQGTFDAELQGLEAQRAALTRTLLVQREAATAQQVNAEATQAHIATDDKRTKALEASADAYRKMREEVGQRLAQAQAEIRNGGELTDTQRFMLDVQQKLVEAGKNLSPVQRAQITAYAATAAAAMRQVEAQRMVSDAGREALEASRAAGLAAFKEAESLEKGNQALRDEIETMGLTGTALAAIEQARISSAIAIKEEELARFKGLDTYSLEEMAIRAQIDALKEKQRLIGARAAVQEDQAAGAALRKLRDQEDQDNARRSEAMADSISVGVLEGARRGSSLMEVFRRELEAQFAKTILRPMIQPFVEQGNKLLGGLLEAAGQYLGLGGGSYNGSIGINGGSTILPSVLRGGADTGTNLVQRDMVTLLHKGEAVVPKAYNPAAGGSALGSAVNITVVNQTGQAASASATRKSDGSIEVLLRAVEEGIAGNVAAGTGPMASALHSRYGLRASFGT